MSSSASVRTTGDVPRYNARQQHTVERLLDACAEELRGAELDALTIRTVAARAGVSPATAYTYFQSKDQLFAELFWRHLSTHPGPRLRVDAKPVTRLQRVIRALAEDLAESPELAAAATRALLGTDPAVEDPRLRIGAEYYQRFSAALGPGADRAVLDTVVLTFLGASLQAGMGLTTYLEMADRLDKAIAVILRGSA